MESYIQISNSSYMHSISLTIISFIFFAHLQAQLVMKVDIHGNCGYCKEGSTEYIIQPKYTKCSEVVHHTMIVSQRHRFKGEVNGAIDTTGQVIIDFDEGRLEYIGKVIKRHTMQGIILYDLAGQKIFNQTLPFVSKNYKENKLIIYSDGSKYGLLTDEGIKLTPLVYDSVFQTTSHLFYFFKTEGKFGIMNEMGKIIHEPVLEKVNRVATDSIMVKRNGEWFIWQSKDSKYTPGKLLNPLPDIMPCYDCSSCPEKGLNPRSEGHCSNSNLLSYLYSHLEYPALARANRIEGTTMVQFMINPDGSTSDFVIKRSLSHGLDEASIEVAKKLKFDRAAVFDGEFVPFLYTLPIKFKLER